VDRALAALGPEQRAVIALHYLLGMSLVDVARCLGIPDGTARSRHHHALAAMRAAMSTTTARPSVLSGGQLA
jgi:RNA polymerase sigma-70 factor (ECF subfamily)